MKNMTSSTINEIKAKKKAKGVLILNKINSDVSPKSTKDANDKIKSSQKNAWLI